MWVFWAGIYLQLGKHLSAETVAGEHAFNRPTNSVFGLPFKQVSVCLCLKATWIPRVAVNQLLFGFFVSEDYLRGVKNDDMVSAVKMGSEGWLVLPTEDAGYLSRHSTKYKVLGIHNEPLALDFARFGGIGTHSASTSQVFGNIIVSSLARYGCEVAEG